MLLNGLAPRPDARGLVGHGELVERYADFALGGTDASVAVLADRLGTDLIVTVDHRHFGVVRSKLGSAFRWLPD